MKSRVTLIFSLLLLMACQQDESNHVHVEDSSYLIDADQLIHRSASPSIKLLDFRTPESYREEHLPTALNIWRSDIEDTSYPYQGMMPSHVQLEALFSKMGILRTDTLVIYDDNGLCNAARLWWILQNYDFNQVKLLEGGLDAWKEAQGPTTTEVTAVAESDFKLDPVSSMKYYVSKEEMQAALYSNTLVLDTRTSDEFSGKKLKNGAFKGGRIPGSIHIDWAEAINYNGDQHLKSKAELEAIYSKVLKSKDSPIIVYCHTGVRSAHTTFVLTQILGYTHVKNYDGSWTEWSYFKELPMEKDSLTSIIN